VAKRTLLELFVAIRSPTAWRALRLIQFSKSLRADLYLFCGHSLCSRVDGQ